MARPVASATCPAGRSLSKRQAGPAEVPEMAAPGSHSSATNKRGADVQIPLGSATAEGAQDALCSQVRQHRRGATAVKMKLHSQRCSREGMSGP